MIFFLYGLDSYSSQEKLNEIKTKFISQIDNSSVIHIDGETSSLEDISKKINTGSLFSQKRLIIINNLFLNKKKIHEKIIDILKPHTENNGINIVIREKLSHDQLSKAPLSNSEKKKLFSFLSKQYIAKEFKPLTKNQLFAFVKKEFKKYNKTISLSASTLLLSKTSNDLWSLSREIKKIAFHANNTEITEKNINEIINTTFTENIFALTDAISIKNKRLAIKLLEEQLQTDLSIEYILTMLIRQFKILWQIKLALEANNNQNIIAKKLKLHPFIVKKSIPQSTKFTQEELKINYNKLIELDYLNKKSNFDLETSLLLFITNL